MGIRLFKRKGLGPYIYQWLFQFILIIPLQIYTFYRYEWSFWLIAPAASIIVLIGLTFAVWATKQLRLHYFNTILQLRNKDTISDNMLYNKFIDSRIRKIVFILGVSALLLRIIYVDILPILTNPDIIGSPFIQTDSVFSKGFVHGIIVLFVWLFVNIPLMCEFVSILFNLHFLLPLDFRKEKIQLDYYDSYLLGGLKSLGNLFNKSTGYYFIGITFFLIYTVDAKYRFGFFSTVFFIGAWILGFVLFFIPEILIHIEMKKAKQEKLAKLEQELGRIDPLRGGPVEDIQSSNFPKKNKRKKNSNKIILLYLHKYFTFNHVEKISVYPFDISTIRDLILTAIIPISAEVFIRIYFHYSGL